MIQILFLVIGSRLPLAKVWRFKYRVRFSRRSFLCDQYFSKNSDVVEIYPSEPAYYEAFAPHPITSTLPAPGTPICIRFYDSQEITVDTKFNTVTGPNWEMATFSSSIPDNLYLKVSTIPNPSIHSGNTVTLSSIFSIQRPPPNPLMMNSLIQLEY